MTTITAEHVRELFHYDPDTGVITRIVSRSGAKAGSVAGALHQSGYINIKIYRRTYKAHRIAWLYMYGEWPQQQLDHINGNRADNRICNLRSATANENSRNRKTHRNNTSGYKGVTWYARARKWQASICVNGKKKCIGYFKCPQAAHEAYCSASVMLHGEFGRTS